MSQTVIGIFRSSSEAKNAVDQLMATGVSVDNIDISSGRTGTGISTASTSDNTTENESGISKFFKNLFGTDNDESDRYTRAAERGGAIVTVHAKTSDEAEQVSRLLDNYGAIDVDDDSDYDSASSKYNTGNTSSDSESKVIPVIEESLQVGKKEIETGGVRLRSRIVEKPVKESLRLREEHVQVERRSVDRLATDAELNNLRDETIELTEYSEVPVVAKEARIVEEISLGKNVEHHEETIRDSVRKTEVDIEEIDAERRNRDRQ